MKIEYENTWRYREIALTPAVYVYYDTTEPAFRCISVHFLVWKIAIDW